MGSPPFSRGGRLPISSGSAPAQRDATSCAGVPTGAIGIVTVLSSLATRDAVLIGRATPDEEVAPQWGGLAMILSDLGCLGATR